MSQITPRALILEDLLLVSVDVKINLSILGFGAGGFFGATLPFGKPTGF